MAGREAVPRARPGQGATARSMIPVPMCENAGGRRLGGKASPEHVIGDRGVRATMAGGGVGADLVLRCDYYNFTTF